jgi:hypothetical protein
MQAKKPLNPQMSVKAPAFVPAIINQPQASASEQSASSDLDLLKKKQSDGKKPLKKEKKQGSP